MTRKPARWLGAPLGAMLLLLLASGVVASQAKNFVTPLNGSEETPPNASQAHGVAIFQLSPDGSTMTYRLIASNIENVSAAHIHIGPPAVIGPVGVGLFGGPTGGGRHDGVLATGSFTAADFVGPLAGMTMADLVAHITAGNAYVNVHTNDGVPPASTGPGDLPVGEIRGQLD